MFSGTTEHSYCFIAYLFEGGFSASPESLSHTLGIYLCHQHPGAQASADTPQSPSLLAESHSTGPGVPGSLPSLRQAGLGATDADPHSVRCLPPGWASFVPSAHARSFITYSVTYD